MCSWCMVAQKTGSGQKITLTASWLVNNHRGYALDTRYQSTQPTIYSDVHGMGDVNGDGLADFACST